MSKPFTKSKLFRFLEEEPRIGRLATTDPDGRPHVVPVWFKPDGERLLIHTMANMRKAKNIAATGRFALAVDTTSWPYRGVMLQGRARAAPTDEIDHRFIEDLTVEYLGTQHRSMGRYMADLPGEHVTLVLRPEAWHEWDYSVEERTATT